ncbi:MAG: anthranilate synthase component I family protein [Thermosulfidibacteraceae bacterium]
MVVVCEELMVDTVTTISLLISLMEEENLFLLESTTLKKAFSRYTYLGIPKEVVRGIGNPFEFLATIPRCSVSYPDFIGDFLGGVVFLIGYGASNYTGILRSPIREGKDLFVGFMVDTFIVIDNYRHRIFLVSVSEEEKKARKNIKSLKERVVSGLKALTLNSLNSFNIRDVLLEFSKDEFEEKVGYIKALIEEGEAIQVVFSEKVTVLGDIDPLSFYRVLRKLNPSPYMFFLKVGDTYYLGSSPEVHLKVKDKIALMKPIAGTYPNRGDLKEIFERLLNDEKERAEHLMLVDLTRNDLYTYCYPETVKVTRYMKPEVYSHVVHLVSTVIGKLPENVHPAYLLKMTFPAGTVSGAPKVRAMEIIDEVEASARDFYAGCVGYVSYNGNLDTAITIRSARLKKGELTLRAGAGIVYDSIPEREYMEVQNKLGALLATLTTLSNKGGF